MRKLSPCDGKKIPAKPTSTEFKNPEINLSRVILFGPRASGKSTVSSQLAGNLNLAHIEFDTINRKKDGSPPSDAIYTRTLKELVQQPMWVADGNYLEGVDRLALPIIWPFATTAIWLDLPFLMTMRRLVARSHRRVIHKEEMWNGMQDKKSSLLKRVASGNAVRAYWSAKRSYPLLLKKPEHSHLTFLHLRTQADVDHFLSSIVKGGDIHKANFARIHDA